MPNYKHRFAVIGLSVLSLALLAGCAGLDDSDVQTTGKNRNPEAVLTASQETAWTGDSVTFNAEGSEDEDGDIVSYRYDFGDGTTFEATEAEQDVEHTYLEGGEYIVTLTVTDNGNDRAGGLSDTATVEVTVNQEFLIAEQVVTTDPLDTDVGSEMNETFAVFESADRFELELEVTGSLAQGSSEIEVRVVDADGDTLASKTVTVQGTNTDSVDLNGVLLGEGGHAVEVEAKSGGATVAGELKVFYGAEDF